MIQDSVKMRKGNQKRLHKQDSLFKNTNFIKLHNIMKLVPAVMTCLGHQQSDRLMYSASVVNINGNNHN